MHLVLKQKSSQTVILSKCKNQIEYLSSTYKFRTTAKLGNTPNPNLPIKENYKHH